MLLRIMKNIISLLFLLLVSIILVFFSVFFGSYIESYEEFRNAPFGLPIPFVYQDVAAAGAGDYLGDFPRRFNLQTDFLDHDLHITFIKSNFIYSVLIVFSLLKILYFVRKIRKK